MPKEQPPGQPGLSEEHLQLPDHFMEMMSAALEAATEDTTKAQEETCSCPSPPTQLCPCSISCKIWRS